MSRRNKLQKFAEVLSFPNVYENFDVKMPELQGIGGQIVDLKGKWASQHFGNAQPITLELACGGGEYTIGLSQKYPEKNFIGVDIKGARIWKGAKFALQSEIKNAAFLRTRIEIIANFFEAGEVDEIWITFPDPFLRELKANRRLTSAPFLDIYRKILKKGGIVHLKTDEIALYDFTIETLEADNRCNIIYKSDDIYAAPLPLEVLNLKTKYEIMHLAKGKTIKYVQFSI